MVTLQKSLDIGYRAALSFIATRARIGLLLVADGKDICITEQVTLLPHFSIKKLSSTCQGRIFNPFKFLS